MAICSILHPEDIKLVLANNKHLDKPFIYNTFRGWLREGLLLSSNEKWVHRRKIVQPTFHSTFLQDCLQVFNKKTNLLIDTLKKEVNKSHTDVNDILVDFTLKAIEETVMGTKESPTATYIEAHDSLRNIMIQRNMNPYLLPYWIHVFTLNFFREWKFCNILHGYTETTIKDQEQRFQTQQNKQTTILDSLLQRKAEGVIDRRGICEEVDTLVFAGHDTTATAISFGLMELACHPEIQDEIVQEMKTVLGDITTPPDYKNIQELRYLDRCIKEILRKYPSAPHIGRVLGQDIVCSGYKLKKGTFVQIIIYDVHHNPEFYPDPEKFDPDRFLPENCKNRHAFAYLPFSAGPRSCIGNFKLEAVDTAETIVLIADVVLKTKDNIRVKFQPRVETE